MMEPPQEEMTWQPEPGHYRPRHSPSFVLPTPDLTGRFVVKKTNPFMKWGGRIAVVLLLAWLGFYFAIIIPAREAAKEALFKRQHDQEESAKAMKAQMEWMKRFNENLRRQDQEMEEEERREKRARDERAKR